MMAAAMEPLVVRSSRLRYVPLLVASVAFVAIGLVLALRTPHRLVGWSNVAFFGACAATFCRQVVAVRPRLVIDERGVFDRTLGVGVIPWSEIVAVAPRRMVGYPFVGLTLRDPSAFTRRLPAWQRVLTRGNRAVGFEPLNLNLGGLPVDLERVVTRLREGMALAARGPVGQNPPA
jgi:hypothetical protein